MKKLFALVNYWIHTMRLNHIGEFERSFLPDDTDHITFIGCYTCKKKFYGRKADECPGVTLPDILPPMQKS